MKFSIFVICAIFLVACQAQDYKRNSHREVPERLKSTGCVYTENDSMLSCHGVERVVECEAKLLWYEPIEFSLFGISRFEGGELGLHYRLFPRALDNSRWYSNLDVSEDGVERYISLHRQRNDENFGLNVVDQTCWERLNELFDRSLRNETVFIENRESETERYQILGDIVVTKENPDKTEVSKRWIYGYGYYGYYPYYRYGLYGAYPYFSYYGKRNGEEIKIDNVPATMNRLAESLELPEETSETEEIPETKETEETEEIEGKPKRWVAWGGRGRWGGRWGGYYRRPYYGGYYRRPYYGRYWYGK